MIEIKGTSKDYIVRKEDIKSIKHYSKYISYVYIKNIGDIEIEEQEYQRLKGLLATLGDKE